MLVGWVGSGWSRFGLPTSLFRGRAAADDVPISRTVGRRELERRSEQVRYHLGRGRRHREAGRFVEGAVEARRALELNPGNPWAYALLGQCLLRQPSPDLPGARRALEQACALDPANGYFVRLLLDVLRAEGDERGREDVLAWSWWMGAPVERWLPDGPPIRRSTPAATAGAAEQPAHRPGGAHEPRAPSLAGRYAWRAARI